MEGQSQKRSIKLNVLKVKAGTKLPEVPIKISQLAMNFNKILLNIMVKDIKNVSFFRF